MLRIVTLILIILPTLLLAQDDTKVKTDSSVIETKYFDYLNSIRVFNNLIREHKTYYTEYYYDSKRLREKGIFIDDESAGIWNTYASNKKLIRQIDYDKGVITYYNKKLYPFYAFQNRRKLMGDSIIKSIYSPVFFNKYVIWNIGKSAIYSSDDRSGEDWDGSLGMKPVNFLLRYNLKVDGHVYNEMIELEIDSNGKLLKNELGIKGFEKLGFNQPKTFNLNINTATKIAKQKGLVETASAKAQAFLYWENVESKSMYNGRFRYYIIIKTRSIEDIKPKGRSSVTDKFDVYVFNPWTSQFIEKKKMKSVHSWEEKSGSGTGLLPDK